MTDEDLDVFPTHSFSIKAHADDELKTFWLSFADDDQPKGAKFLGVCIVDVTGTEANEALIDIFLRFPMARDGAEWLAAATRKCHCLGINPGGDIAGFDITGLTPPDGVVLVKDCLLSKDDLREQGHEPLNMAELAERGR